MSSGDAMISRVCRAFSDTFAKDEATAREQKKKYWISRVLGSGATGTVLCAKRVSDGEAFAVKCVDMEGMSEADKNRAQAEVHCLLNCNFFSIVKCHEDLAKKDPKNEENVSMIALVLDYANAGDLRQEIKSRARTTRTFREHEAGLLFLQVLLAIHHVHSRHMIHRDIKSANILLCSNGLVKLGDFGFSKMYSATVSDDVGRTFCGTPYYVAPEIWRRKPYSKKADMFSLGVLLYELLTLKRPFDGANMNEVMQKTLSGKFEPLSSKISPEMAQIVSDLLCGEPRRRPSSGKLLSAPICKLFMSGLLEIVQSQSTFQGQLRDMITEQIQQTKQLLQQEKRLTIRRMEEISGMSIAATSTILEGAQPLSSAVGGLTLYEGTVRKQSSDMVWKRRYLCIRAELAEETVHQANQNNSTTVINNNNTNSAAPHINPTTPGVANPMAGEFNLPNAALTSSILNNLTIGGTIPKFKSLDLVLAVNKETVEQQCIVTPFSELEDVFPVPSKYTGSNANHVFAVAFKTGKRLSFQARSDEDRDFWMEKIQEVLGIGDDEEMAQSNSTGNNNINNNNNNLTADVNTASSNGLPK